MCLSQVSYIKIQAFWFVLGKFQSDFCENLTEFYQMSLKMLAYLTDFSSQFIACLRFQNWDAPEFIMQIL